MDEFVLTQHIRREKATLKYLKMEKTQRKLRIARKKDIQEAWNNAHMSSKKYKSMDSYDRVENTAKKKPGHTFLPSTFTGTVHTTFL